MIPLPTLAQVLRAAIQDVPAARLVVAAIRMLQDGIDCGNMTEAQVYEYLKLAEWTLRAPVKAPRGVRE